VARPAATRDRLPEDPKAGHATVAHAIVARAATAINPGAVATSRADEATAVIEATRGHRIKTASNANHIKPIRGNGWAFFRTTCRVDRTLCRAG
jgi:hypothetical protein